MGATISQEFELYEIQNLFLYDYFAYSDTENATRLTRLVTLLKEHRLSDVRASLEQNIRMMVFFKKFHFWEYWEFREILRSVVHKCIELDKRGDVGSGWTHLLENVLLKCAQERSISMKLLLRSILDGNPDYWNNSTHRFEETVEKLVLFEEENNLIDFIQVAKHNGYSFKRLGYSNYRYESSGWHRNLYHSFTLQKAKTVARLGYQLEALSCHPGDWTAAGWKLLMNELAKSSSLKVVNLTLPTSLPSNDVDESRIALQHFCQFKQAQLQHITLHWRNFDALWNDSALWLQCILEGLQCNLTDALKPLKKLVLQDFNDLPLITIERLGPLVDALVIDRCWVVASQQGQLLVSGDSLSTLACQRAGEKKIWEALAQLYPRQKYITARFTFSAKDSIGTSQRNIGNFLTSITLHESGTNYCVNVTHLLVSCLQLESLRKLQFWSEGYHNLVTNPVEDGRRNSFHHKLATGDILAALKHNSSLEELKLVDVFFAGVAASAVTSRLWDCVEGHMALRRMAVIEGRRVFTSWYEDEMDWRFSRHIPSIISTSHSAKIQHACSMNNFSRNKMNTLLPVKEFVGLLKNVNEERRRPSRALASILESLLTRTYPGDYYPLYSKDPLPFRILRRSVQFWCHRSTEAYQAGTLSILYDLLREVPGVWCDTGRIRCR